jgi:hypothetical protein
VPLEEVGFARSKVVGVEAEEHFVRGPRTVYLVWVATAELRSGMAQR